MAKKTIKRTPTRVRDIISLLVQGKINPDSFICFGNAGKVVDHTSVTSGLWEYSSMPSADAMGLIGWRQTPNSHPVLMLNDYIEDENGTP